MYSGEFSLVAGRLKDQVCIPENFPWLLVA